MKFHTIRFAMFLALLIAGMFTTASAQKGKGGAAPAKTEDTPKQAGGYDPIKSYQQIFHSALTYNDFAVATDAMYHLIALQPEQTALKDTLAALYFQRGAWPQVVIVTTEILDAHPDNQSALELRAVANQSIGRAKESLADYETMYKSSKNPYHMYEIAALQFTMKRFGECEISINQLLGDESIKEKTIAISVEDGRSQDVPLAAAAMNLHGVLELEQGKKESAKTNFQTALKIYPEFILAKNNMDAIDKMK